MRLVLLMKMLGVSKQVEWAGDWFVPLRGVAGLEMPRRDSGRILLLALTRGGVELRIPEVGRREVREREWCLLGDFGPLSELRSFAGGKSGVGGFGAHVPVEELTGRGNLGCAVAGRLSCLSCPRMDRALFVKGSCCGRLLTLAGFLAEVDTCSAGARWRRLSYGAEFVGRLLERPELQVAPVCRQSCVGQDLVCLERIARYLEERLEEGHTIAGLSRRFFLNECKLKQGFREHFGTTVGGYLRQKRMERAWAMLEGSDCTVLEAALAVGYQNGSHFARAFREVHALNPGELVRRRGAVPPPSGGQVIYQTAVSRR